MLVALSENGDRVNGWAAPRGKPYWCPSCEAAVILKHGRIVVPHFAHKQASSTCVFGEPETPDHVEMKYTLWQTFHEQDYVSAVDLEYPIAGLRADVFVHSRAGNFAIEVQRAQITPADLEQKLGTYTINDVPCLYIVHHSVIRLAGVPGTWQPGEWRVPAWVRELSSIYFGRTYVFDRTKQVCPMRLSSIEREASVWYTPSGEEMSAPGYTLKTKFHVRYGRPVHAGGIICTMSRGFYIARFTDRAFWNE